MVKTKYKKKITQIIKIFATNVVKVQLYIVFTGFWADKIDQWLKKANQQRALSEVKSRRMTH